jgi:BlaR1 peptidase M56
MTRARNYYRFALATGGLALLTLAGALAVAASALSFSAPGLTELLEACRGLVPSATSAAGLLMTAITSLGVASVACGARAAMRHHRSRARILRHLRVVDRFDRDGARVLVVEDLRPRAFCFGILRPRVYVSTGALAAMSGAELEAVVAHEGHHVARRDPLRILIAQILRDALFFLPIMRHVTDRYTALAEVAADEAAVRRTGDRPALASAMLTFEERAPEGTVGIAPERVDHLLGRPPGWQLSRSMLGVGVATLAAIAALGAAVGTAAPAQGISTAAVIMQVCGLGMVLLPVLGGTTLVLFVKRSVTR